MEANFEVVHLELKYCERCGGLWIRGLGSEDIYCAGCALAMSQMAAPHTRRDRARLPVKDRVEIESTQWTARYGWGGNA